MCPTGVDLGQSQDSPPEEQPSLSPSGPRGHAEHPTYRLPLNPPRRCLREASNPHISDEAIKPGEPKHLSRSRPMGSQGQSDVSKCSFSSEPQTPSTRRRLQVFPQLLPESQGFTHPFHRRGKKSPREEKQLTQGGRQGNKSPELEYSSSQALESS